MALSRGVTNLIRYALDNIVPPVIRDSRPFMYPLAWYWFKGKNVSRLMEFKSYAASLSTEEMAEVYRTVAVRANDRPTDLNEPCLGRILQELTPDIKTVLDVGCGRGYLANLIAQRGFEVTGCDLSPKSPLTAGQYVQASAEALPFADQSFDAVVCSHTLEHLANLPAAVAEIKRVARRKVIVAVPCQRPYYYTLDLHLHFFPYEAALTSVLQMKQHQCLKLGGDWVYVGLKET